MFLHGRRDSNSRQLVLETSALPLNYARFLFIDKGVPLKTEHPLNLFINKLIININLIIQLPDQLQLFYHPHGLRNVNQYLMQLVELGLQ